MDSSLPPKKSLGQHWLHDPEALEAMVRAADVQPDDMVVEVGPGLGTLTELLVATADQVIAVEYDERLACQLPQRVPDGNLSVVQEDILRFDFTSVAPGYKVVANIPYYLTSNLIRVLSESPNPPATAALLIQKEVAERVAAQPGDMSLLSITAQFYWEVSLGRIVPAELFTPPPKVDSQIVILQRRPEVLFPDVDAKEFFRLVRIGFSQRRKTLLNALSSGMHLPKPEAAALIAQAGIDARLRPQNLSLSDWRLLYQASAAAGK